MKTPRELRKARNEETEVELTKDELEEFEYGVAKAYVAIRDALREEAREEERATALGLGTDAALALREAADAITTALHPGTVAKGE